MASIIADTACVDPRAEIADGAEVGPYCIVGPEVRLGGGSRLVGHVHVMGRVEIGEGTVVRPFSFLGSEPPDRLDDARHDSGRVVIGDFNIIGENVTIARGGSGRKSGTRIGSRNILMAASHIGRDCVLGDRNTLAQGVVLGQSVLVENDAVLSAGVVVQPFATIGALSFVAARSRIDHDVPPYLYLDGLPAKVRCIHIVGLRRKGVARDSIAALHEAYRLLYRAKMEPRHASEILEAHGHLSPEVRHLLGSLDAQKSGRHRRARDRPRDDILVEEA